MSLGNPYAISTPIGSGNPYAVSPFGGGSGYGGGGGGGGGYRPPSSFAPAPAPALAPAPAPVAPAIPMAGRLPRAAGVPAQSASNQPLSLLASLGSGSAPADSSSVNQALANVRMGLTADGQVIDQNTMLQAEVERRLSSVPVFSGPLSTRSPYAAYLDRIRNEYAG